jgi:tetratricopeptide (TPR) repeat protein
MKWMHLIFIVLAAFFTVQDDSSTSHRDGNDSAFAKANQLYTDGNYQEAATTYQNILQSGQHSAELYYNLGNSYYKLNDVAPAIYNYEKALQLDPGNVEVLNNLKFAQQMRVDTMEPLPGNPVEEFFIQIATTLSTDGWAYTSIMLAILTVLFFVLYYYSGTSGKKRLWFVFFIFGLLLMLASIAAGFYSLRQLKSDDTAIVFATETVSRTEPNTTAEADFILHAGTKVEILEEYNSWSNVKIANGETAWIATADLKKI